MKKCDVMEAIFSIFWHAIVVTWLQNVRFFLNVFFCPMLYLLWKVYTVIQYHVLRKLFLIQSYYPSYNSTDLSLLLWKLVATPSSLRQKKLIFVRSNVRFHVGIEKINTEFWIISLWLTFTRNARNVGNLRANSLRGQFKSWW